MGTKKRNYRRRFQVLAKAFNEHFLTPSLRSREGRRAKLRRGESTKRDAINGIFFINRTFGKA